MFAADLCKKALRTINVLGQAVPLSAADLDVAFEAANDMLDGWAAVRLTIFQTLRAIYPLVAGQGAPGNPYTIGPGGDFDQVRPLWIPNANVQVNTSPNAYEIPLDILKDDEYAALAIKTIPNTIPTALWYNGKFDTHGADVGLGEIYLWMVPNGGLSVSLVLYNLTPLTKFADKNTTDYSFPPGYAEALRYQLALRLAPEFAKPITPEVAAMALTTFAVIQRPNAKIPTLRSDLAVSRSSGYD